MEKDFDFVERPSQDFFCPVSLEFLLEPQLTSCCGHHLSLEASTRLHREGKACPMCNAEQWSAVLDKYHRRRVHEVRVRCWHKDKGCDWVGEVNGLKQHADSCAKRLWECEYCGLQCEYGERERKHRLTCLKFPEPCPNTCEVGSVERFNMEQHLSVCPLEPVACEMKEFGCSVVVPRKELARHMRESELQHLTAMTVMNLRLTRQLQQEMSELKAHIQEIQHTTHHIETHTAGETCSGSEVLTFADYSNLRGINIDVVGHNPFYSHHHGYKLKLVIRYHGTRYGGIGALLYLMKGEYDDELSWPVKVKVQLELLNQAGDHHHVVRTESMKWMKEKKERLVFDIPTLMTYSDLEKQGDGVQYMMNDCLKFRIHITTN